MNRAANDKSNPAGRLPTPIIKKMRKPMVLIWLVPVCAAIMAGYYYYDYLQDRGLQISLTLDDATGLKAGESQLMHLGVEIGKVTDIQLSPDQKEALIRVRLRRSAASFARKGAVFWVVRPEISSQSISGLGTVLSGPFIDSNPGAGEEQEDFVGLDKAPTDLGEGLRVLLEAPRVEHLQPDSPVYFRGIQVGTIEDVQLRADASIVDVHAFIQRRFSPLVKTNSQFWVLSAVDVKGGLFTGVQMKVESLQSILSGGVEFATPEKDMGQQAKNGSTFVLHDDSKPEWLNWAPAIAIQPDKPGQGPTDNTPPQPTQDMRSIIGPR
jgi:paraquat-inducible protein B